MTWQRGDAQPVNHHLPCPPQPSSTQSLYTCKLVLILERALLTFFFETLDGRKMQWCALNKSASFRTRFNHSLILVRNYSIFLTKLIAWNWEFFKMGNVQIECHCRGLQGNIVVKLLQIISTVCYKTWSFEVLSFRILALRFHKI